MPPIKRAGYAQCIEEIFLEFRHGCVSTISVPFGCRYYLFCVNFYVKVALGSRSVVIDGLHAGYVYFNRRFLVCRGIVRWLSLPHLQVTCTARVIGRFNQWKPEEFVVS